jgi:tetratricopeptide (TPR) repeat protein
MRHALTGVSETARARYTEALEIQQPRGDLEGAGLSLGALASLGAQSGDALGALDLYRQALSSFEDIGDRGEEARILSEMAWTYLAAGDTAPARRYFFESVRAHTDIASVRGVGLPLVLGADEAVDGRDERAAQIAAAAEMLAQEEGIVVVYSDETPGRELVEQARAALAPDELARATQLGRRLTIAEVLELATRADRGPLTDDAFTTLVTTQRCFPILRSRAKPSCS